MGRGVIKACLLEQLARQWHGVGKIDYNPLYHIIFYHSVRIFPH